MCFSLFCVEVRVPRDHTTLSRHDSLLHDIPIQFSTRTRVPWGPLRGETFRRIVSTTVSLSIPSIRPTSPLPTPPPSHGIRFLCRIRFRLPIPSPVLCRTQGTLSVPVDPTDLGPRVPSLSVLHLTQGRDSELPYYPRLLPPPVPPLLRVPVSVDFTKKPPLEPYQTLTSLSALVHSPSRFPTSSLSTRTLPRVFLVSRDLVPRPSCYFVRTVTLSHTRHFTHPRDLLPPSTLGSSPTNL